MSFQPLKPWQDFTKQLQTLKDRKLIINNEPRPLHYLQSLGYYRLSGYFYPFRQIDATTSPISRKDDFIVGTTFEDVLNLYLFDKQLRLLAFDALERIEMAIRVDIAYTLGKRHPNAHKQSSYLDGSFCKRFESNGKNISRKSEHQQWLDKYDSLVSRARKQDFIAHNLKLYGRLPIWVACEILDFGALSRLYNGMQHKDKQKIADKYNVSPDILSQWLRSLNFIRNVVAHHSRLWNANMVDRVDFIKSFPNHLFAKKLENRKPFGYFYIMAHLLKVISPTSTCKHRLKRHIQTQFPQPNNNAIKIDDFGYLVDFQQNNW